MSYYQQKDEIHSLLLLGGVTLSLRSTELHYVVIAAVVAFALMFYGEYRRQEQGVSYLQAANAVTLVRLMLLLTAAILYPFPGEVGFGLIVALVAIGDAVDGYLARKLGLASKFGASFDMETDALFVSILSLIAYMHYDAGILVLVAGQMRFLFVWILRWTGMGNAPAPHVKGARVIAVIFFVALITPYFLESSIAFYAMQISAVLICCSFAFELVLRMTKKGPHIE